MQLQQPEKAELPALLAFIRGHDGTENRTHERHARELAEPNRHFFVAYENDTPVAYVQLLTHEADNDPQLANGRTVAHIHDLRVLETHRRQGVAQRAMKALEKHAFATGFKKLTLGVDTDNFAAQSLYAKLGYGPLKRDDQVIYLVKSKRNPLEFVAKNFGPLIVFWAIQYFAGLKIAIAASMLTAVGEFIYLKTRQQKPTPFLIFSTALALVFGVLDLWLTTPIFFKFEAGLTNLIFAGFFAASLWSAKPLVQEFAEESRSFADHDPRDVRFFFQVFTAAWALYFVAKAVAYTYINFHVSVGYSLLARMILGNATFAIMIGASMTGGRPLWLALTKARLMPSTRAST